ncbi:hypothetical protein OG264_03815 [Streptomyces xanthophaeus]|uniref:hypothetical protein n=1 Tax=Streptomyces xanthophaeus TaxID=67385 RepID=UPI0038697F98|nr:hypothetical protein OG264_03815 [Streptomyces xanthophaeus]WST64315.1 hypothetical protein OG605_34545 [Streptomyces xanthophaeus]
MLPVPYPDHLRRLAESALAAVPATEAEEVYALSFLLRREQDDPRLPVLTIGYNTETRARLSLQGASDPQEARWNYAFWIQNELAVAGDPAEDPAGAAAREEWIRALGLWYEEPQNPADATDDGQIEARFREACCLLARTLHTTGVIERSLGRTVPVIVHELEYDEETARLTEAANPPGLADAFTDWVRHG